MAPPPPPTGYGLSDPGRVRSSNEDAFLVDDDLGLYVVADGMGGHAAGEVASREALDTLHGMVKRGIGQLHDLVDPLFDADVRAACRLMESAVQAATYHVYSMAQIDRDKHGMGTTMSAALVLGDYAVTAHAGDSRIYGVHDGAVEQLTRDHTLVNWQVAQGIITPLQAAVSPQRNIITRAVGIRDYIQVDTCCVPVGQATRLLLRSDGLHGYLDGEDLQAAVALGGMRAVRRLVQLANERGGKDNITAVLVEVAAAQI